MTKSEYAYQLKTPAWLAKRNEILERDNHTCCRCGTKTGKFQVHHIEYINGRDAWEYDNSMLETLCGTCHQNEHPYNQIKTAIQL